jgi:predicted transcriptional regulator
MSAEILFCFEGDPVDDAEKIMRQSHLQRLDVLHRGDEHLIGVISLTALSGGTSERRPYEVIFHKTFTDQPQACCD